MITYIKQDKFYKQPTPESRGNCQQAAVASILGLQLNDVPNFMEAAYEGFWGSYHKFLKSLGLYSMELGGEYAPGFYYLAYGESRRGCRHACVYHSGNLAHDPHPDNDGLLNVDTINILVPYSVADFLKK